MDMTTFGAIVVTIAVATLYLMALKANARAQRAEAALARVEAVIAEHPRYTARTVGAVVSTPITGEVAA